MILKKFITLPNNEMAKIWLDESHAKSHIHVESEGNHTIIVCDEIIQAKDLYNSTINLKVQKLLDNETPFDKGNGMMNIGCKMN